MRLCATRRAPTCGCAEREEILAARRVQGRARGRSAPTSTVKPAIAVRHNEDASRFEAIVDGLLCRADYRLADGIMRIVHTEVPYALEGRGIAAQLVRAAIAHAEANGLKVEPRCGYVRAYMRRHPDTHRLLPDGVHL